MLKAIASQTEALCERHDAKDSHAVRCRLTCRSATRIIAGISESQCLPRISMPKDWWRGMALDWGGVRSAWRSTRAGGKSNTSPTRGNVSMQHSLFDGGLESRQQMLAQISVNCSVTKGVKEQSNGEDRRIPVFTCHYAPSPPYCVVLP